MIVYNSKEFFDIFINAKNTNSTFNKDVFDKKSNLFGGCIFDDLEIYSYFNDNVKDYNNFFNIIIPSIYYNTSFHCVRVPLKTKDYKYNLDVIKKEKLNEGLNYFKILCLDSWYNLYKADNNCFVNLINFDYPWIFQTQNTLRKMKLKKFINI